MRFFAVLTAAMRYLLQYIGMIIKAYRWICVILYVGFCTLVVLLLYHYWSDLDFLIGKVRDFLSWLWSETATSQLYFYYKNKVEMWQVSFTSESVGHEAIVLFPTADHVIVVAGDTVVFFVKIVNHTGVVVTGISVNYVFPEELSDRVSKIMCFCYNEYVIFNSEFLDFPIVYKIATEKSTDKVRTLKHVTINYSFYRIRGSFVENN